MQQNKNMTIWGAGQIGRGFIADIFHHGGYDIQFIDADTRLVDTLNERQKYTIYTLAGKDEYTQRTIGPVQAVHTDDHAGVDHLLDQADAMAVVVFPGAFSAVAEDIARLIRRRMKSGIDRPCDIYVAANIPGPEKDLKKALYEQLAPEEKKHAEETLGFLGTIIMVTSIQPTPKMLKDDPLASLTDNDTYALLAGTEDVKNKKLDIPRLRYVDNIYAEGIRKMYAYNMSHAFLAYLGQPLGYKTVYEALQDKELYRQLEAVLKEVSAGLVAEFGFDVNEMQEYCQDVLKRYDNPYLNDSLLRVGGDVSRKIGRHDRLIGPALICRKHGIYPYYLTKAVAYACVFQNPEDPSLPIIQKQLQEDNQVDAFMQMCGLESERELAYQIKRHYQRALEGFSKEDTQQVELLKQAYQSGFASEKKYRGCAQCALLSLFEVNEYIDKPLFQAASGFSGGMAITGDGCCGGYTGGVMFTSSIAGRRYDEMLEDGDKDTQYASYEMAQYLHDHFVACYGSVICEDIHKQIFGGTSYSLRTKEVRDAFEEAGAHEDKCTTVVAVASMWTVEALINQGITLPVRPYQ